MTTGCIATAVIGFNETQEITEISNSTMGFNMTEWDVGHWAIEVEKQCQSIECQHTWLASIFGHLPVIIIGGLIYVTGQHCSRMKSSPLGPGECTELQIAAPRVWIITIGAHGQKQIVHAAKSAYIALIVLLLFVVIILDAWNCRIYSSSLPLNQQNNIKVPTVWIMTTAWIRMIWIRYCIFVNIVIGINSL